MGIEKNEQKRVTKIIRSSPSKKVANKPKYVQSKLVIGSKDVNKLIKCTKCGMTYSNQSNTDTLAHTKFHDLHLKGRKWSNNWGQDVHITSDLTAGLSVTPSLSQDDYIPDTAKIVMVRPNHTAEVNATLEIMTMVNNELSAPHDENSFWSKNKNAGKAFVYVKNGRAVGVITMEILEKNRGRWMIYKNKAIIQKARPQFILGISRIWVCKSERLQGIATKLVNAARQNTIFGEVVDKRFVSWSQPSDNGGKMALKYNSVKHGSGEILIPCYI
ncbi:N-acetyltransferase Eco1p [Monosporozyma unispora]